MTNNLQSNSIETEHLFDKTTDENYICGDGNMKSSTTTKNIDSDNKKLIEKEIVFLKKLKDIKNPQP